jgi:ATP/maltotriose-dependent transcriptional regulator MalT
VLRPANIEGATMPCAQVQYAFTARLSELKRAAESAFRNLPPDRREEAVQNVLALAWKQYRALVLKGRDDAAEMLGPITFFAIRQTKCGRMIQGCEKAGDTYEKKRRGKVVAEDIDVHDLMGRSTPVLEAVSFRIDIPKFFDTLSERQRHMARLLASGFSTSEVAELTGVTAGAVSQFRQRFKALYDEFFAAA